MPICLFCCISCSQQVCERCLRAILERRAEGGTLDDALDSGSDTESDLEVYEDDEPIVDAYSTEIQIESFRGNLRDDVECDVPETKSPSSR